MNYNNYAMMIIEIYVIQLVEWPVDVKFISPSSIRTVGEFWKS